MISPEAAAIHQGMAQAREQRANAEPVQTTLAQRRAGAEHQGDLTSEPTDVAYELVQIEDVPAQWVIPTGADPDRVLIYFHAGGYGYCSMNSHRKLIGHIAKAAKCRAVNVDYSLAPENPHPAAVNDASTVYRWLLAQGFAAPNVAVVGDSAGGGLALALAIKSRDDGLPVPGAAALMSPWVDLALTGPNAARLAQTDLIQDEAGSRECARVFLAGQDPTDPLASPLYADLRGLSPIYLQVGDAEITYDDSVRLAEKARAAGVEVRLDVYEQMQHDFQMFAGTMPEADDAIRRLGEFLQSIGAQHVGQ